MSEQDKDKEEQSPRSFLSWMQTFFNWWTVGGIVLVGVVMFYGDNDVFQSIDDQHILDSLRVELQANRDTTEYYRALNRRLESDPEMMEQVVREQYGMKRATEDAYTFIENE